MKTYITIDERESDSLININQANARTSRRVEDSRFNSIVS